MPKPADTTHGASGRPVSRDAATIPVRLEFNPTLADLKNANPEAPIGTASDFRGSTAGARDPDAEGRDITRGDG